MVAGNSWIYQPNSARYCPSGSGFAAVYAGFFLLERFWALHYWGDIDYYPPHYMLFAVPIYILILLFSVYLNGGYVKKIHVSKIVSGVFFGMIVLLVFYSLLPSELRYSRALIVLGSVMSLCILLCIRFIRNFISKGSFSIEKQGALRYAIVAELSEAERVAALLRTTDDQPSFTAFIAVDNDTADERFVGNTSQIEDIIRIYSIDEVVFCSKSLSQIKIGELMSRLSKTNVRFTIVPPSADFIIGSNTIKTPTDLYVVNVNSITSEDNRRKKRLLDVSVALIMLLFYIVLVWFAKNKKALLKNIFLVLFNRKTWVGYSLEEGVQTDKLPKLKPSVFSVADMFSGKSLDKSAMHKLNLLYAGNYSPLNDLQIICKSL